MVTEARVGHVTFWRLLTGLESKMGNCGPWTWHGLDTAH